MGAACKNYAQGPVTAVNIEWINGHEEDRDGLWEEISTITPIRVTATS